MIITCPACATQFRVDGTRISQSGTKVRCARCSHVWLQTPDGTLPYTPPVPKAAPPPPPPAPEPLPAAPVMVAPAPVRFPEPEPEPEHAPPPPPEPLPVLARPSPFARAPEPEPARAPIDNFPKVPPTRPTVIFPDRSERTLPVMLIVGLIAAMLAAGGIVYSILHFRGAIMSAMPVTAHAYCAVGVTFPDNGLKVNDVKAERTFADGMPYLEVRGQVVNTGKATASVPRVRAALKDKSGKELYSWNISATASQLVPGQSADFSSRLPSPDTQSAILTVQLANPCSKS